MVAALQKSCINKDYSRKCSETTNNFEVVYEKILIIYELDFCLSWWENTLFTRMFEVHVALFTLIWLVSDSAARKKI